MVTSGVASFSWYRCSRRIQAIGVVVALLGHQVAGVLRDRMIGMVVDLRAGHDRQELVQQVDELAEHPRLRLAAEAQEEHVMPRQDGILDLGHHRLFITQDIGKERLAGPELPDQVAPHLVLDRLHPVAACPQFPQSPGPIRPHRHTCLSVEPRWSITAGNAVVMLGSEESEVNEAHPLMTKSCTA